MSEKKPFLSTSELVSIAIACAVLTVLALLPVPDLITIPIAVFTVGWIAFTIIRSGRKAKKES